MADLSPETRDLVMRARSGDREGFTALYGRLAPALHAWLDLRLPGTMRSQAGPEDLMHEVWWRALDAFGSYDPDRAPFRSWLFTIAKRVFIDAVRRAGVAARTGWPSSGAPAAEAVPASVTEVSRRVARDQVLADVLRALRNVDETDQAVFVHCGLEGRSASDAAPLVALSRDAVLKRWQRLRERLRREVPGGERLLLED